MAAQPALASAWAMERTSPRHPPSPCCTTATPAGILRFQKGQTAASSFDLPLATNGAGTVAVLPFVRGNGMVRVTLEVDGYTP